MTTGGLKMSRLRRLWVLRLRYNNNTELYGTSKVGESAKPSHWHLPFSGSLTQLEKTQQSVMLSSTRMAERKV